MPRHPSSKPTEVELEILLVLWEHGPCPMGKIHGVLSERRDTGYTTTQKMVQVMREKGLVQTDSSVHPQLYTAADSREETQLSMLDDLAQRAFGGSAKKLVMSLLSADRITAEELREIQRLLRQAEGGKR
jgi:BlaI family penicillinase repressor